jgi:hypothetical protein
MRRIQFASVGIFALVVLAFLAGQRADAESKTTSFKGTFSGTGADIPIDLDSDSCTTSGGVTVCADFSGLFTFGGKTSGGVGSGHFTGQGLLESDAVPGTGCKFASFSLPIHSCTIGSVTSGCEFQLAGASSVFRDSATGDLEIFQLAASPPSTVCVDLTSGVPPFNIIGTEHLNIMGGTGKFAGVTGTFTATDVGQTLSSDAAGHGFGWFSETFAGTETRP